MCKISEQNQLKMEELLKVHTNLAFSQERIGEERETEGEKLHAQTRI
jgi:hypothetical protein